MNQCDGCRRKLPLVNGLHRGPGAWDLIGCTADRYKEEKVKPKATQEQIAAFRNFASKYPAGTQKNILESMERGESLTFDAFIYGWIHGWNVGQNPLSDDYSWIDSDETA